jgi:hypothetical protein
LLASLASIGHATGRWFNQPWYQAYRRIPGRKLRTICGADRILQKENRRSPRELEEKQIEYHQAASILRSSFQLSMRFCSRSALASENIRERGQYFFDQVTFALH